MKRILWGLVAVVALVAAYLAFWPVPIHPVAWAAPVSPGYTGPYLANTRLASAMPVPVAPEVGPEHIEFGPDGRLYTGVLSGKVLRMQPDGSGIGTVVDTGGRPLGLAFDPDGRLLVADAFRGLLRLEPDGRLSVLADRADGTPILFADAVAVGANGALYLTDASQRFSAREYGTFDASLLDIMEHACTGRVLEVSPASGAVRTVAGGLCFPNGIAVSGDQRSIFVAETGEYRVWRFDVAATGLDARQLADGHDPRARVVVDNLPGYPDNLTRDGDGRLWTGLTKPRSDFIDANSGRPWLMSLSLRLPKALWPVPPVYGHVIAFDESGRVVMDLQDPSGQIPETSGATVHGGRLYVHSLHGPAFGLMDAPPP
ncbi:MAG: SMP-30/gluconolactonase/LRE family protein [Steroidobacteraceae bacterium]